MHPKEAYRIIAKSEKIPTIVQAPILVVTGAVFQGLGYMDPTERTYKILQNIGLGLLLYKKTKISSILVSLLAGHLLGFVINGQFPVALKNLGLQYTNQSEFERWLVILTKIGKNNASISAIGVYGSLSRGGLSSGSDLDVRIIRRSGMLEALGSCFVTNLLRLYATISLFPLDIYVVDSTDSLSRLRDDEQVTILVDKDSVFRGFIEDT